MQSYINSKQPRLLAAAHPEKGATHGDSSLSNEVPGEVTHLTR